MSKTSLVLFFFLLINPLMYAQTDTVYIDFGRMASPAPWNNITDPLEGRIDNLMNNMGYLTGISIYINDAFNNVNSNGIKQNDTIFGFPATATGDSFFGNTLQAYNKTEPSGGFIIRGLKPNKSYSLVFCASRPATENRHTQYIINGLKADTVFLNPSSDSITGMATNLFPALDSTLNIKVSAGPKNKSSSGFYYIGAIMLIYEHEPPSGPASLALTSPIGGEFWQTGKSPSITWSSANVGYVAIDYSNDNGATWTAIDTVKAFTQKYTWLVPLSPSKKALVRLNADTLTSISKSVFEISTDCTSYPIVVLGSSTAAGVGTSSPDSSWVGRYRNEIFNKDTRYELINISRGGYSTYHILPNGTTLPKHVNIKIDTARNISKALTYRPLAIIVNMPSNDVALNFGIEEQLNNYLLLKAMTLWAGSSFWICTPQARNFKKPEHIQMQIMVRDFISDFFEAHAIDFWSGIADTQGTIKSMYDFGDGVHLNDAGHKLLFEKMMQRNIHKSMLEPQKKLFDFFK